MPELIHLYIRSVLIGFAVSVAFTAGLILWDVAGIGHLILASDIGLVAALMMVFFNGILFAAVQFAFRIMSMAEDTGAPTGGHRTRDHMIPVPIEVTAKTKPRRPQ